MTKSITSSLIKKDFFLWVLHEQTQFASGAMEVAVLSHSQIRKLAQAVIFPENFGSKVSFYDSQQLLLNF